MRRPRLLSLLLAVAMTAAPGAARAHGGADHGERVVAGDLVEVPVTASPAPAPAVRAAGAEAWEGTGPREVAVVQVLLPGRDVTRYPAYAEETLRQAFFTGTSSASRALHEMTDGIVSLTGRVRADGDVLPSVTASSSGGCRWQQWAADAQARLAEQGISLDPYLETGNVAYVLRGPTGCSWGGLAWMPGNEIWLANSINRSLVVHELGHNFSLDHASSARCRDGQGTAVWLASRAACELDEYGDPFDPMGDGNGHYSAPHKRAGGWLPSSAVRTVDASGTYVLQPAADPLSGTRMLRIPRPDGRDLTIELRRSFGTFDVFPTGSAATNGVLLRLQDPDGYDRRTNLLDTTPATSTFGDAALAPGKTVVDTATGLAVRLDALDAGDAKVSVSLEGPAGLPSLDSVLDAVVDLVTPDPPPTVTPTPVPPPTPPATTTTTPPAPVVPVVPPPADEDLDEEDADADPDADEAEQEPAPVARRWRRPVRVSVDGRRRSAASLSSRRPLRGRAISARFSSPVRELRVRTVGCRARVTVRVGRSWRKLARNGIAPRAVRDVRVRCTTRRGRVTLRALSGR